MANTNINKATDNANLNANAMVKNTNSATPGENVNSNDPFANFKQYDNKIVNISSADGKVKGQIGFKLGYDESGKYPMIRTSTFLLINEVLPQKNAQRTHTLRNFRGYQQLCH